MLCREALKRVDAAQTDGEDISSEHLGAPLVTFVEEAAFRRGSLLLCDFSLALCRGSLAFGYPAAPQGKHKGEYTANQES